LIKLIKGVNLVSRGELVDGLGSFDDGVLGQFSGEEELDSGLDFTGGEGVLLVVSDQLGGFEGDSLEDIVDEGVHDGHGLLGDTSVVVDLLEDLVDVHGESLVSGSSSGLLLANRLDDFLDGGGSLGGSAGGFSNSFLRGHDYYYIISCLFFKYSKLFAIIRILGALPLMIG
jgi:hypothetical protein